MARERMVTRTISFTEVTVISMNIETVTPQHEVIRIAGVFDNEKVLLKKLKKRYETDLYKIVAITDTIVIEKLYGMSEEDFIENAKELPPRSAQSTLDTDEDDDTFTLDDIEDDEDDI